MTQSKQEELNQSAYNILNEYRKIEYGLVKPISIDKAGYQFNHPVLPPNEQAFLNDIESLINSEVTAALEELEKDMQDPNNVEFYIESKNELLSSTEYIQTLKEKYKSE